MPEANSALILSKIVSQYLRVKPGAAGTVHELLQHSGLMTAMIYDRVFTNEPTIDQVYFPKISPEPLFSKEGNSSLY